VGAGDAGSAFARYFFALRDVDDIDGQVGQFRAESGRQIVATGFDEAQFRVRKFAVHFLNRREVHGGIFANGGVRTPSSLNTHDALGWESFRARQDELIFFRVDVIGDHVDLVVVAKLLAERFD